VSLTPFKLSDAFVKKYEGIKPDFGFNGLGEIVFLRTYSRLKADGTNEKWFETVRRVVEGTFRMQQRHILSQDLGWSDRRAQKSAQEMYDRMFRMLFLPPGRGMWAMGSPITEEKGLYAALNNCAFVSTENLGTKGHDPTEPFTFLMDASMLGIGVGFDTKGAGKLPIMAVAGSETYIIPDSREGWVESLRLLLEGYFDTGLRWKFDYSLIRAEGEPIKGFGGVSSGPGPLIAMHEKIAAELDGLAGEYITTRAITDIMNLIGVCVVSGNVRRSAEIAFGAPDDEEFLALKDYEKNPERAAFGWTSNNSIFAEIGMDYTSVAKQTQYNGEPGYMWLDNARDYSRMNGPADFIDRRVKGANPCVEQSLEDKELCCLVETFPDRHTDLEDFERTLKYAYLYAKTVTLGKTHWPKTNRVMLRNRRIGTSLSGLAQFLAHRSLNELKEWCEAGYETIQYYDQVYSEWLAIPRSIKTTSIKPSGSISNLPGATSGMHYPEDRYYIRRVRLPKNSALVEKLFLAGYYLEPDVYDASSMVAEFPVHIDGVRIASEVSMWEQLALAAFLQRYWADNQVSCTVTFDPATEGPQIKHALDIYQYQLKGISFLPRLAKGAYNQMPYQAISRQVYDGIVENLAPLEIGIVSEEGEQERGCSTDVCEAKWSPEKESE
jgi:ribonucleotide reductase alpha subunit